MFANFFTQASVKMEKLAFLDELKEELDDLYDLVNHSTNTESETKTYQSRIDMRNRIIDELKRI